MNLCIPQNNNNNNNNDDEKKNSNSPYPVIYLENLIIYHVIIVERLDLILFLFAAARLICVYDDVFVWSFGRSVGWSMDLG